MAGPGAADGAPATSVAASIRSDRFSLTVRALHYEFPELETGADANWVTGEAELTVEGSGRFAAHIPVSLRTEEIARFVDQLRAVESGDAGAAELSHLEEEFGATIRLTDGHRTVEAFLVAHAEAELRIPEQGIEPPAVRRAREEFGHLSQAFPVRGEPLGPSY